MDPDPDPGSALKKMDPDPDPNPDPGHSVRFNDFFYFFSLIFILKLNEPFRNEEIFISLFSKVQILGFGVKKDFFFAIFG